MGTAISPQQCLYDLQRGVGRLQNHMLMRLRFGTNENIKMVQLYCIPDVDIALEGHVRLVCDTVKVYKFFDPGPTGSCLERYSAARFGEGSDCGSCSVHQMRSRQKP